MIVNSSIITGFLKVRIEGMYFGLVSCSGIVKVTLWNAGSHVLESKMWVGMNLPQAIPFDEIQIESELDQPVEFWAGKVSMTNANNINSAAKAIRTAVQLVDGEQVLTGYDLTRSAVRVRSDKEVFLGGSGFGSRGWRVPAGGEIEVPLAGVISAYKREAFLDYSSSTPIVQESAFFASGGHPKSCTYVSKDEQTRVFSTSMSNGAIKCTTDGGVTWNTSLNAIYGYEFDPRTGIHYALQFRGSSGNGRTVIFNRSLDGVEWETMYYRYHTWPDDVGTGYAQERGAIVGRWFQRTFEGMSICADIETGEVVVLEVNNNGVEFRQGAWLDEDLKVGVFGTNNELFKTEDGGSTWRSILPNYYNGTFSIDSNGVHLFASSGSRPHVSEDGGETWHQVGNYSWSGQRPTHVKGNLWITHRSSYVRYVDMPNGTDSKVSGVLGSATPNFLIGGVFIKPNGEIYTSPDGEKVYKTSISVVGDLTSARVEVMELLS